jgi:hypothetical protein
MLRQRLITVATIMAACWASAAVAKAEPVSDGSSSKLAITPAVLTQASDQDGAAVTPVQYRRWYRGGYYRPNWGYSYGYPYRYSYPRYSYGYYPYYSPSYGYSSYYRPYYSGFYSPRYYTGYRGYGYYGPRYYGRFYW